MEQRQSSDRMNLQARASHINDTRCHDKVDVNLFQLPRQRSHAAGAEVLSVANSDHIGASGPQSIDDGSLIPKNRNWMAVDIDRRTFSGSPTRNTYSRHPIARASHPLEFCRHGGRSVVRTNDQDRGQDRPSDRCFTSHFRQSHRVSSRLNSPRGKATAK